MSQTIVGFFKSTLKKIAPELQGYSRGKFGHDFSAGITVGIVALPLSLALAIATGVPPILGLYTAGIAGFLASFFAGSPFSVSGPAAAMVPILSVIIHDHGMAQLPYITILAAVFLLLFAAVGVGKLIQKVPESVVLGFTSGVAIVLFCGQLNSFLGLHGMGTAESFAGKLMETITHATTLNWLTVLIGLLSLAIIILWPRLPRVGKIPATLIAVIVSTLAAISLSGVAHVATLGSAYGALSVGFPAFNTHISPANFMHGDIWMPAFEIAALITVETLLCAVVADKLTKRKHNSNQELMAQGIANLGSAMFGGIPATAVIARTGTIVKNGAKSRVASLLHALVVLLFVVALAPLAAAIPLTTLSAVLLVTAYKIGEIKEIARFVRTKSWRLSAVLGVTMLLTIFTDLVMGVSFGLLAHAGLIAFDRLRGLRDSDGPLRLAEEEA